MRLAEAWMAQARSDLMASEVLLQTEQEALQCQCISKYQQAVEKSVKGLATAVNELGNIAISIGYTHPVERIVSVLLRNAWKFPSGINREVQLSFSRYYGDIRALDRLAPRRPEPGQLHARNTEYPYEEAPGVWTHPSEKGSFTKNEVRRFRRVAEDVNYSCGRLVSTIKKIKA